MNGLLSCASVSRAYRSGAESVRVLDDVTLTVEPGELVLLVGPSGSGKTTLLSILAGLLRPDSGQVHLAGQRIDQQSESEVASVRRHNVGFVFQTFHLFAALSARDNVAELLRLRGVPFRAARREAEALLSAVGLGDRTGHRPAQLSSGQKQRVAIARAFAGCPEVVFCDEPTAALDGESARAVMQLLREHVVSDRAALVVTHDLRLARYADRVLRLDEGKLWEES